MDRTRSARRAGVGPPDRVETNDPSPVRRGGSRRSSDGRDDRCGVARGDASRDVRLRSSGRRAGRCLDANLDEDSAMSTLTGHWKITEQAVKELSTARAANPLNRGLGEADLPTNAVTRDVLDVLILGHWADFGQKHHFMRKFDGQREYEAHQDAVDWIRSNALEAAQTLEKRVRRYFADGVARAGPSDPRFRQVFAGVTIQTA